MSLNFYDATFLLLFPSLKSSSITAKSLSIFLYYHVLSGFLSHLWLLILLSCSCFVFCIIHDLQLLLPYYFPALFFRPQVYLRVTQKASFNAYMQRTKISAFHYPVMARLAATLRTTSRWIKRWITMNKNLPSFKRTRYKQRRKDGGGREGKRWDTSIHNLHQVLCIGSPPTRLPSRSKPSPSNYTTPRNKSMSPHLT